MSSVLARAADAVARELELQLAAEEKLARYATDPVSFCRDILKFEPWSKQAEILESVRDHTRTAVRSSHGSGKSAVAARAVLWFLATKPNSRVITTAPTWNLVRDVLWKEIGVAHAAAGAAVGGKLSDHRLELGPERFAIGLSTDKPERFQGHHAEHLLLVVDEASGVEEGIFEAAAGYMTNPNARMLLIGNPTQLAGEFYAAFHGHRHLYNTIAISTFDTPAFTGEPVPEKVREQLPSPQWLDDVRAMYGGDDAENNPVFQVRALGQFPTVADDAIVPLGLIEQAHRRTSNPAVPVVVACDVARFGSDETVIAIRSGNHVRIHSVVAGKPTTEVAGAVLRAARDVREAGVDWPLIVIDDPGVGGGVTDILRERLQGVGRVRVIAFNGAMRPRARRDYPNRRSELWFTFADRLPELDLEDDQHLVADLVAPKYTIDSQGRRVVEAKEHTKKRLGRSPDRGDAVVMTFADIYHGGDGRAGAESAASEHDRAEAIDPLHRRRRDRSGNLVPYGGTL